MCVENFEVKRKLILYICNISFVWNNVFILIIILNIEWEYRREFRNKIIENVFLI